MPDSLIPKGRLRAPADKTMVRGQRPYEPPAPEVVRAQMLDEALQMIAPHEGYRERAYRDPAGVWTVGYGETGPSVGPGATRSREAALNFLRGRLVEDAAMLERQQVPLSPGLLSATYNLGPTKLRRYGVLEALRAGEYDRGADILETATKARVRGRLQDLPGLVTRRRQEATSIRKSDPNDPLGIFRTGQE